MTEAEPLARLVQLYNEADKIIGDMIREDLKPVIEQAAENEAAAAELRQQAYQALQAPQAEISSLDAEITKAEAEAGQCRADAGSGDMATRVTARLELAEWERETATLRAEKARLENAMMPLVDADREAQRIFREATQEKQLCEANLLAPFLYKGQETPSYIYRLIFGGILPTLILGDETAPEWQAGRDFLKRLCVCVGITSRDLPTDAQVYRPIWDEAYKKFRPGNEPERGMAITGMEDGYADDYRAPAIPRGMLDAAQNANALYRRGM